MSPAQKRRYSPDEARELVRECLQRIQAARGREDEAAAQAVEELQTQRLLGQLMEMAYAAPPAVAVPLIRLGLGHSDSTVRRSAAETLLTLAGRKEMLPLLGEALANRDEDVRRCAAEALEAVEDPAAVGLFRTAMSDSAESVRRNAAESFELVIGSMHHPMRVRLLEAINTDESLRQAFENNTDVLIRRHIARALAFGHSQSVIESLRRMLRDEDFEVRQECVLSLFALKSSQTVELLREALNDTNYLVCSTVLDVMASKYGSTSDTYLEFLRQALQHENVDLRRQAVICLDRYPYSRVKDILEKASRDPDLEVSRRAGEMLGRDKAGEHDLSWLDQSVKAVVSEDQVGAVWEAGNIGQESRATSLASARAKVAAEHLDEVIEMLEWAVAHGDSTSRLHAASELVGLRDVTDSPGLRASLQDKDAALRAVVADALARTRDAQFLIELSNHPDAYVRRKAVEALAANPGGTRPTRVRIGGSEKLEFSKARSAGVVLCRALEDKLDDRDEEVRRSACEGLKDIALRAGFLPPYVVAKIQRLHETDESYLVTDAVDEILDALKKTDIPQLVVRACAKVLETRAMLARLCHGIRFDAGSGEYSSAPVDADQLRALLGEAYDAGLASAQLPAIAALLGGRARAKPADVSSLIEGLPASLALTADALCESTRALRLLERGDEVQTVDRWLKSLTAEPRFEWENSPAVNARLDRTRAHARYAATACRQYLAAGGSGEAEGALREQFQSRGPDEVAAGLALLKLGKVAADDVRPGLSALVEADQTTVCRPLLVDALATLLAHDAARYTPMLCALCGDGSVETRAQTIQALMNSAIEPAVRDATVAFVRDAARPALARLGAAIGALGNGAAIEEDLLKSVAPGSDDMDLRYAEAGALAAIGERKALDVLKDSLRKGSPPEQLQGALYLGLDRVRSAIPIFSSASDKPIPYGVRSVCASQLIIRGHADGALWFGKSISGTNGVTVALVAFHLARGVVEAAGLMRQCGDVNFGRFL